MTTIMSTRQDLTAKARATLEAVKQWPHWHEIQLCAQKEYHLSEGEFQALLPHYPTTCATRAKRTSEEEAGKLIDKSEASRYSGFRPMWGEPISG